MRKITYFLIIGFIFITFLSFLSFAENNNNEIEKELNIKTLKDDNFEETISEKTFFVLFLSGYSNDESSNKAKEIFISAVEKVSTGNFGILNLKENPEIAERYDFSITNNSENENITGNDEEISSKEKRESPTILALNDGEIIEDYNKKNGKDWFAINLVYAWFNEIQGNRNIYESWRRTPEKTNQLTNLEKDLLLHFFFDETPFDAMNNKTIAFDLKGTRFVKKSLFINGAPQTTTADTNRINNLKENEFCISLDFYPLSFNENLLLSNLLIIGSYHNWFIIGIHENHLYIAFENYSYVYLLEETNIQKEKWHNIIINVDFYDKIVNVMLDGERLSDIIIDGAIECSNAKLDKRFTFKNYESGGCYHGYVDNLMVYNRNLHTNELISLYLFSSSRNIPEMPYYPIGSPSN